MTAATPADIPPDSEIDWTDPRRVRDLELRYLLTDLLAREQRVWKVAEIVAALRMAGFVLDRRTETASKLISSALRAEVARGRVVRVGWGRYMVGRIPGSTLRRIRKRVRQRRERVARQPLSTLADLPIGRHPASPDS